MINKLLVTARDIEDWTDRLVARSQIPRLLRRLISTTTPKLSRCDIPSDEEIQLGGWDGLVEASDATAFVPKGISVWEIGVNQDIKGKADDDYDKRTKNPLGLNRAETTFIFVTPRRWPAKNKWIEAKKQEAKKKQESSWADIRAYDADDISQWLENALVVHLWVSSFIGKLPESVEPLELFWENWVNATTPTLSTELIIAGRTKECKQILGWIKAPPSSITVYGGFSDEALVFLAASIYLLSPEEQDDLFSRIIIVRDENDWQTIALNHEPLILIPQFNYDLKIGRVIDRGHHVFISVSYDDGQAQIKLPNMDRDEVERSLITMGKDYQEARALATLARRSLPAFRRKLAIIPGIEKPEWANPVIAQTFIAPLLVGVWNDGYESDKSILARLSGKPYEALQEALYQWRYHQDPPFRQEGAIWMVAAREDAWRQLNGYISPLMFSRFEEMCIEVFSEVDPSLMLPLGEQLVARFQGQDLSHSKHIRQGIVDTLAMMASLNLSREQLQTAQRIVWRILSNAKENPVLFNTIAPHFPLLAEAAPHHFLQIISTLLDINPSILIQLFQDQSQDYVFSASPHTYLLWALERLAWNADYLGQAASCLVELANIDPGGKLSNRPRSSLQQIFFCGYPCTSASLEQRVDVLKGMIRLSPIITWKILISQLPNRLIGMVMVSDKPRWQRWADYAPLGITMNVYYDAIDRIFNLLLSYDYTALHWCDILENIKFMSDEQRNFLLDKIEQLDINLLPPKGRSDVCQVIRRIIIDGQDSSSIGALSTQQISRFEQLIGRLQPEDIILQYQWLFNNNIPVRYQLDNSGVNLFALRVEALEKILSLMEWDGIIALNSIVDNPNLIGDCLASMYSHINGVDMISYTISQDANQRELSKAYFSFGTYQYKDPWVEGLINEARSKQWDYQDYTRFLLVLPITTVVIDILDKEQENIQRYYWQNIPYIRSYVDIDGRKRIVDYLLKFERPHLAISELYGEAKSFSPDYIISALFSCNLPLIGSLPVSFEYITAELIDYLASLGVSHDILASLEWLFFSIHQYQRQPKFIYKKISNEPDFFMNVIDSIYTVNEAVQDHESEYRKRITIHKMLSHWTVIPGKQDDNTLDGDRFNIWMNHVRLLASQRQDLDRIDGYIGRVLAFSPEDADGLWPHHVICDFIEITKSQVMEDDFSIQILNNQGVTMRTLSEGGKQERALAQLYENRAQRVQDRWPRVGRLLSGVAQTFRGRAEEEDHRARLTQDFWQ